MLPTYRTARHAPEPHSSRPAPPSRLENVRRGIQGLFTGSSAVVRTRRGSVQVPESPKTPRPIPTPRPILGLSNMPTTRLNIPFLSRSRSDARSYSRSESRLNSRTESRAQSRNSSHTAVPPAQSPLSPYSANTPSALGSVPTNVWHRQIQQLDLSYPRRHRRQSSSRRFVGVDPEELHLAQLAEVGRRRRDKQRPSKSERRCAPKIKNRKIRSKMLSCFVSAIVLIFILTVYLALALSNKNERQEFHVLLILLILVTTIFFCHSLIRLCMMLIHPPEDRHPELPATSMVDGYASPRTPIRVALARDEEAVGIAATKYPPPAYGLWRESVRVDPDRIYWQRNENARSGRSSRSHQEEARSSTANRPPSYISEEGVEYVIEAQPRSAIPIDVFLPVHPSERGRVRHGL